MYLLTVNVFVDPLMVSSQMRQTDVFRWALSNKASHNNRTSHNSFSIPFQYIIWVTDYTCTKRSKVSGQSACLSLPTDNRPMGQICYIIISDKAPPGQRVEPTWGQILL